MAWKRKQDKKRFEGIRKQKMIEKILEKKTGRNEERKEREKTKQKTEYKRTRNKKRNRVSNRKEDKTRNRINIKQGERKTNSGGKGKAGRGLTKGEMEKM